MPTPPKPCKLCGGPKPKGKGILFCNDCIGVCPTHGRVNSNQELLDKYCKYCKDCRAAYMRGYLHRNPEMAEYNRRRARANTYGLSLDELELWESIKCCEVCDSTTDLHIDHDHNTGAIRGILCSGCNVSLGHAKENPETLRKLALYIERRTDV